MTELEAAWLAGYIDGDGCICLEKRYRSKFRSVRIVIDSADRELLDEVIRVAGGGLTAKTKKVEHHRQCWTWRLTGMGNVIPLLETILPYMRCAAKKNRAELIVNEWALCTPRNGFYTDELLALKESFEERFLSIGEGRGKRAIKKTSTTDVLATTLPA